MVSTLGGFGSEEQMKRINGEANILAVNAAKEFGEESFSIILQFKSPYNLYFSFHCSFFIIFYVDSQFSEQFYNMHF